MAYFVDMATLPRKLPRWTVIGVRPRHRLGAEFPILQIGFAWPGARQGDVMATTIDTRAEDILESLTRVVDPAYGINIVDLGVVYGIEVVRGRVRVEMAVPSSDPSWRTGMPIEIEEVLRRRHPQVSGVSVEFVNEPEWREDFITDAGRMQMRRPVRPASGTGDHALTSDDVIDSLMLVLDPEVGINIVDLGLIYNVTVLDGMVHIRMTLTTPGCPLHDSIEAAVRRVLETRHPEIRDIEIELVWEPAWDVDKITPAGRAELGW